MEERLTPKELASKLKVSVRTVRTWVKAGMPFIPAGSRPRFILTACEEWLGQRAQKKKRQVEIGAEGPATVERVVH